MPVTVVNRPRQHETTAPVPLSLARIGNLEAALATERAARERAERSLQEALAALHDLQTKQGHAELARREALETAQTAQRAADTLRAEFQVREARLQDDLAAECAARAEAERAARVAAELASHEAARARMLTVRQPDAATTANVAPMSRKAVQQQTVSAPAASMAKRTRKAAVARTPREPQPVKWWIKTSAR